MVEKVLTYSETNWRYLKIGWELRDLFPEAGTRINIIVRGQNIDAVINKRKTIRCARLFKILKPKPGDVLSITRKSFTKYEIALKHG